MGKNSINQSPHWDQAVGRIRALSDRNLTVEDVLLYYRLYRFDKNLVDKVMDRHRSAKPAAEKISLEDAEIIMNRIVADEPHLKSDSVTLDQEVRPMTYVSTPKLIPTTVTPLCNNPKSGAVSKTRNKYLSKNNDLCVLCGEKDHYYFTCTVYPTVSEKKATLKAEGRCENCSNIKKSDHYCYLKTPCSKCKGRHKWQLCETNEKSKKGSDQD